MNKLKTIFRSLHWKNILGLTIAGLINAFGITIFLSPVNLYGSTGYATVIEINRT